MTDSKEVEEGKGGGGEGWRKRRVVAERGDWTRGPSGVLRSVSGATLFVCVCVL
jgi:hypothetical protein